MVYGIYNELVTGAKLNQQTYLGGLTLYDFIFLITYSHID